MRIHRRVHERSRIDREDISFTVISDELGRLIMTKPITDRPLMKNGRKAIPPPRDAGARIEALAEDGFSIRGVAARMGVAPDTFRKWLEENPALQEAFDNGRESERYALHNMLYRKAIEKGDSIAAMFLLKSRHGYREGDQGETGNRVQINFQLPGSISMDEFKNMKVIENERADNRNEPVPTQRIVVARGS
jgi:hypothetical protein